MNASLDAMLKRLDDPAHLHASAAFTEALARLHFAAEHRLALSVVVGASGTGKTTLLRRFRRDLTASAACIVQFQLAALTAADLQTMLAQQLGLRLRHSWVDIARRLTEYGYDHTPLILLADDASNAHGESLDFLSRLWDADSTGQLRISMVMAIDELSLAAWPEQWLQRIDLRVELQRWSIDDVTQFLQSVVGDERRRQRGFEPAAIERLHELSHGLPRLLRRYAHLALLATEGQERTMVDEHTVTGATHELCRVGASQHHDGPAIEFLDDDVIG
jgi:general secretion pathway protein A